MCSLRARLATFLFVSSCALGQGNSDVVRNLNNRVLQLQAALGSANASEQAQIRSQAGSVISQRAQAMAALIRQDPSAALALAFSKELRADLAQKFPLSAKSLEEHGTWSGKSDHLIFDDPARQTRRYQVSVTTGNEILEIYSSKGEPECVSGNTLTSTGIKLNNVVAAGSTTAAAGTVAPAATCSTLGAQNSAVILIDFPGYPLPSTVTPAAVNDIFFANTGKSVNTYWKEASYNQASATGQVFGPFTLSQVYSCDQYNEMRAAAIQAADPYIDYTKFSRIFIVFANPGSCAWAGLGSLGCSSISSAEGTTTASTSWLLATYMSGVDNGVKLATHEGGHNLTLHHSASRDFGSEAVGPLGAAGTLNEYGDPYSTMGTWNFGHYAAPHKVRMGWLTPGNVQTIETSGTYSILPFESSTLGVQALKVRRGTGGNSWLWLEYRQPLGIFDSTLPSQVFSGALVHMEDSTTGTKTHLLDFTPATTAFTDSALVGAWTDPYTNLQLGVTAASPAALSLNITYGALTCTAAAPSIAISPSNPSVMAGTAYGFTLTVTNNDSLGCGSRTFALSSSLPSGWTTTFSSASLTLTPGQTLTASMNKTVPVDFTPGTYAINATVADSLHSITGTNNITVIPSSCVYLAPTISLSPATVSVLRGATQNFTMTLKSNDVSPCASRTYNLSSSLPLGWISSISVQSLTLSAGATATATLTKTVPADAPLGSIAINAIAQDSRHSVTGNAAATVAEPTTTTLVVSQTAIRVRSSVTLTATVVAGGTSASGATISFRIVRGGSVTTLNATANSAGTASVSFRAQQKGTYTATATGTLNGANSTSNTVTFTAQ